MLQGTQTEVAMKVLLIAAMMTAPAAMAQDKAAMCAEVLDHLADAQGAVEGIGDQAFYIADQANAFALAVGGDIGGQIARRAEHDRLSLERRASDAEHAANDARAALMAYCAP